MDRKSCHNCWWDKGTDCRLGSSACATAVLDKSENPPRWTSIEEGLLNHLSMVGRKEVTNGAGNGQG